jgi:hypothetical protein
MRPDLNSQDFRRIHTVRYVFGRRLAGTATILLPLGANPGPRGSVEEIGWEMAVRIEIIVTVLHKAHRRQVEETMEALAEGSEEFYTSYLD